VSIALFLLLSGFFLAALFAATERSRKLLAVAGGCLAAIVCIIVFLEPVQLPSLDQIMHGSSTTTTTAAPPGRPGAAGSSGVHPSSTTTTTGANGASLPGPVLSDPSEVASVR